MLPLQDATSTHHDSALGRWSYRWQRPSEPLRGWVDGYVGYRQRLATPATHRGIPSTTVPLVLNLGPPTMITDPAAPDQPAPFGSFVAGLYDRHVLIDADEHHGIQVDLRPIAAHRLLGLPLGKLAAQVVDLEQVFGGSGAQLVDELASLRDWPSRFRRLDQALRDRLERDHYHLDAEVEHAYALIRRSHGRVRVRELVQATGWSERRLSGRFRASLGLPPKRMARLTRFEHALALMTDPAGPDLATIAAVAGFTDQAHLANEVRGYTGLSATALLARRLPDSGGVFDV